MEICNKESSMSSFNEFRSLIFIHFKSLAPLSGQALVTDRLWATADNFTRFGNITLSDEMLHILVSNHSSNENKTGQKQVKCQVALPCLKVDKLSFLQNSAFAGVN